MSHVSSPRMVFLLGTVLLATSCSDWKHHAGAECAGENLTEYYARNGRELGDILEASASCPGVLMPRFAAYNLMALGERAPNDALSYFDTEVAPLDPPGEVWAEAGFLANENGRTDEARRYLTIASDRTSDPLIHALNLEVQCTGHSETDCRAAANGLVAAVEGVDVSGNVLLEPTVLRARAIVDGTRQKP